MPEEQQKTNIPGFLIYRPDEALVQIASQMQAGLEHLEREIGSTNHIPTIKAQRDQNLPMFKMLTGLVTMIHQDVLRYTANVTEYLIDQSGGEPSLELAVPPELADEVTSIFSEVEGGINEILNIIGKIDLENNKNLAKKVKESNDKIVSILNTMLDDLDEAEKRIEDATYVESESEEEEEKDSKSSGDDYEPLL